MPPSEWLDLPFAEQIEYFKQKIPLPTERWNELEDSEHDAAFVVSQITKADLLLDVKRLIEQAIASGMSLDDFKQQFKELIKRQGWTEELSDSRLRTIYDTNIRRSHSAGRYEQMSDPALLQKRPYWMWRHRTPSIEFGGTPRPEHKALNNKVFPASHPFWKVAFPMCAWGCRCDAFAVSESYMQRKGLKIGTPPDPKAIAEPGFRKAPGSTPKSERDAIIEKKLATLPPDIAEKLRQSVRTDSTKPTRAGYHWVEDKSVKKGGYWRKNPKGSAKEENTQPRQRGNQIATGLAIAGLVGAGAIAATSRKTTQIEAADFTVKPPKFNGRSPDGLPLPSEAIAAVDASIQNLYNTQASAGVDPSGSKKETWKEFAQVVSIPSGEATPIIGGESTSVRVKKSDLIGENNIYVHTHPTCGSLSFQDLAITKRNDIDSCIAVDRGGNIYHGKLTTEQVERETSQEVVKNASREHPEIVKANQALEQIKSDPKYAELVSRIQGDYYTKQFVSNHAAMRYLKAKGVIDYDYQLTPKFSKIEQEFEAFFQELEAKAKGDKANG